MKEILTGRTRFRVNFRGKVILQVEISLPEVIIEKQTSSTSSGNCGGFPMTAWRDAIVEDLTVKEQS